MKNYLRSSLLALALVATMLVLASCASSGGGSQGNGSGDDTGGMNHGSKSHQAGGEMAGMGHGSSNTASGMLMENGRYSDERFIDAMVPHHQGAVEMAQVALENAEHEEITQLSQNIISTQQAEIEELKSIKQEEFGTSQVPKEMSPQQMQGMGVMADPQELANKEPFDRAFIDAMIPHHQSAIGMARVAAEKSENPQIKHLAGHIISAQQAEIEQMKRWQKEWYPEG
jgi:uncharacterized protein (DUF305 family)